MLYQNTHFARAYFLAVAAIEETGKAFLAFDGRGRKLTDTAISKKLKQSMEDHSTKITWAFAPWLIASPDQREIVTSLMNLMIHLKRGREPSMYTDIRPDSGQIQIPAEVVREKAARDCIRLANDCFSHTQRHIADKSPHPRTRADDQLFAMKKGQLQRIANTGDFWEYYLARFELGKPDFAEAVVGYNETYIKSHRLFKPEGLGDIRLERTLHLTNRE